MADLLAEYLKTGGSILMASHDDDFAANSGAEITSMESLGPS